MNKLDIKTRVTILNLLVEGSSMGSISRTMSVSINTVTKLLEDAGRACAAYHKTLKCTPAMAAGVSATLHDMAWIVGLIDANAPAVTKRRPYRKKDNSNRDTTG